MSPKIPTFHDTRENLILQQSVKINKMNALKLNYNIFYGNTQSYCIGKILMLSNPSQIPFSPSTKCKGEYN